MPNFLNYENIIKLFQSLIENILCDKARKCAIFPPETEIIQRIVNYTNKILENLFEKYLHSLEKHHFWEIISSNFEKHVSIKYINSLEYLKNEKEKSFIWIFLELFCVKQIDKLLVSFRNIEEICKEDLYRLIHCIQKIIFIENFSVKSSLFEDFSIFSENNSLEKRKVFEDLRNQWTIHYNQLIEYKKDIQILGKHKISPKKQLPVNGFETSHSHTNSNESTPITKSNFNLELNTNEMNENDNRAHNSDKIYQTLFKGLITSFAFEKAPKKIPTVFCCCKKLMNFCYSSR